MGYSFDRIWDLSASYKAQAGKAAYPVKLHAPVGAGDNYFCPARAWSVDCIDGLSQYRTQTQSLYCIHLCPSDFYLWQKMLCLLTQNHALECLYRGSTLKTASRGLSLPIQSLNHILARIPIPSVYAHH